MAEAILYGTAARFLGDIASIPLQEIASAWNVKKDLKKLEATMSTIKSVLLDAEQQQRKNNGVRNWLGRLKHAFYELDNLIDDFATEVLRRKLRKYSRAKEVHDFFSPSKNQVISSFKMSGKIKAIRDELDDIASDRTKFHFKESVEEKPLETSAGREETHSFVRASMVIGRDEDKKAILELVMDGGAREGGSIIPIVGIGGLGKTTLAQLIYNDEIIGAHFELKMWVCVSDVFSLKVVIEKMLKSANREFGNLQMDQLQKTLRESVDGKRFLLILDDVWNENREKWIKLKELLMGGGGGSKILVTTRSENVAMIMGTVSPYHLKGLSEENCWSLFEQLAFKQGQFDENPILATIGKEILKKCGGVPLAIRTVGSLLYLKETEIEWSIVRDELWGIAQEENHILPTLKVSYDHLPPHLRQCFAYCSLFPKDCCIEKWTLVKLWMAQGFIHSSYKDHRLDDIGDQYFKELLFRSFFQDVEKDDYGRIMTCKMHDLIHDLAQVVAGTDCSLTNASAESISERTYHVSFDSDLDMSWEVPASLLKANKMRTFLHSSSRRPIIRSTLEKVNVVQTLITNLMSLRVLDLHRMGIENVPSSIGKLKHLRYLDLSWNINMTTLPISICKLQNLQTLKLSYCHNFREFPVNIRKLVSLRHLEIDGCDQLNHMPYGLGKITYLQTLPLFVLGKDISISKSVGGIGELNCLNHLRGELKITGLENMRHGASVTKEQREANLKAKQYLQVLALKWELNEDGAEAADADTALLEDLQPHPNLKELYIKGYEGFRFPSWMMVNMVLLLPNLVQITIENCRKCQQLPSFGQLPFLKVLELRYLSALEYIHNDSVESSSSRPSSSSSSGNIVSGAKEGSFFPSLKQLSLFKLPLLKEWPREVVMVNDYGEVAAAPQKVSLLSFPCLTKLDIHGCPRLISMPLFPILEELEITYIGEKLLQSVTTVFEADSQTATMALSTPSRRSTLKRLYICFCEDLVALTEVGLQNLTSLQLLEITQCHKLVCLTEEGLRGLTSLQSLYINFCDSLASLSQGMQHLSVLKKLTIANCESFDWSDEDDDFQGLTSLQHLKIGVLPKLVSLPNGLQHLTTLQVLDISHCDGLVNLPEWMGNLTTLKKLYIGACHKLESLPDTLRCLIALEELEIINCNLLSERCKRERGSEWHKICHIPRTTIM